ncbi:MAG: hypothetical protein J6K55_04720 [Clostridia bacterium]|nr:hypothetical protein [Clostridia bacterium]
MGILIGIDGGGTHSTAAAAWPDGRIAARCEGGGLNFHNVGVDTVRSRLEEMARTLSDASGAEIDELCAGMSALDFPADEETTALFTGGLFTREMLDLQSDAYAALIGLTQGRPGVIVICGTGSMLVCLDQQGRQHASGGWGYLLGDAGSSYTLAREALLRAIDQFEGLASKTALAQDALGYFGAKEPRKLIDCIYPLPPEKVAGFAKHVLIRAAEGEEAALEIVSRNMRRLALQAAQLVKTHPESRLVGLYGGVFEHNELARRLFGEELRRLSPEAEICSPDYPPELGALIHLFQKRGALTPEVLENLKSSYYKES